MMTSIVSIGMEGGGPETKQIMSLKISLVKALDKFVTSSHCPAIDQYALVLRVDGTLQKYGQEGLENLRFSKVKRYISADIQIPVEAWWQKSEIEFKRYLAEKVKEGIHAFVGRLRKDKLPVSETELYEQIESATEEFLAGQLVGRISVALSAV